LPVTSIDGLINGNALLPESRLNNIEQVLDLSCKTPLCTSKFMADLQCICNAVRPSKGASHGDSQSSSAMFRKRSSVAVILTPSVACGATEGSSSNGRHARQLSRSVGRMHAYMNE